MRFRTYCVEKCALQIYYYYKNQPITLSEFMIMKMYHKNHPITLSEFTIMKMYHKNHPITLSEFMIMKIYWNKTASKYYCSLTDFVFETPKAETEQCRPVKRL